MVHFEYIRVYTVSPLNYLYDDNDDDVAMRQANPQREHTAVSQIHGHGLAVQFAKVEPGVSIYLSVYLAARKKR